MWRQMLTFILLPCLFGTTSDVSTKPETNEEHYLYFPLVEHLPIRMEVVVTSAGSFPPSDWKHIYGYVQSQEPDPIYSVLLEVEGTYVPFCDPGEPCDPFTVHWDISPALTATLPGQVNPFSDVSFCYKSCFYLKSVRVISASRTEPDGYIFYPLTIVEWEYADGTLFGTIRNDNRQTLQKLRLVVAELGRCGWKEAEIAVSTLAPGLRTTFQLEFLQSCLTDNLVIVGQGAALP